MAGVAPRRTQAPDRRHRLECETNPASWDKSDRTCGAGQNPAAPPKLTYPSNPSVNAISLPGTGVVCESVMEPPDRGILVDRHAVEQLASAVCKDHPIQMHPDRFNPPHTAEVRKIPSVRGPQRATRAAWPVDR